MKPKMFWALFLTASIFPGRVFPDDAAEALQAGQAGKLVQAIQAIQALAGANTDRFAKTIRLEWSVAEAAKLFSRLENHAGAVQGPRGQAGFQQGTRTTGGFPGRWRLVGIARDSVSPQAVYVPSGIKQNRMERILSFSETRHPFVPGGLLRVARTSNLVPSDMGSGWTPIKKKDQSAAWSFTTQFHEGAETRETHDFDCRLVEPGQMLCRYGYRRTILECPPAGVLSCGDGYLAFSLAAEAEKVEDEDLGWRVEDARELKTSAFAKFDPSGALGLEGHWRLAAETQPDSHGTYIPGGRTDKALIIRAQQNPFTPEGGGVYAQAWGFVDSSAGIETRCEKNCGMLFVKVRAQGREQELELHRLSQDHALGSIISQDALNGRRVERYFGFVRSAK